MSWRTGGPIWPMPPAPLMWLPAACCGSWQGRRGATPAVSWGVYYLVTGCCYQPRLQGGRVERLPWREVLRTRYHAETCGGLRYAQAAEATEDVCLREIWEELSAAEYRHARQLLSLLEQMVLA